MAIAGLHNGLILTLQSLEARHGAVRITSGR